LGWEPRIRLGAHSEVIGAIAATDGSIVLEEHVKAKGRFYGQAVDLGEFATLEPVAGADLDYTPCKIISCFKGWINEEWVWDCEVDEVLPIGTSCDDGDICTEWDHCDGEGFCVGVPINPDPEEQWPCIRDLCDPVFGKYEPEGTVCDETNTCREQPTTCNGFGGCSVLGDPKPVDSLCDDGIPNNGLDTCDTNGNCSGEFGPFDCLANNCSADGLPPDLECWLEEHEQVRQAIKWAVPNPAGGVTEVSWPDWSSGERQELQQAFEDAWEWFENGMTYFPGTPLPEPMPNQEPLADNELVVTVFDGPDHAWPLYLANVGHILALEIKGILPWSLCDYPTNYDPWNHEMAELLRANRLYWMPSSTTYPGGYTLRGTVTPAHPTVTFTFMLENDLIGSTRLETITRVLQWARRMRHYVGAHTALNMEHHWGYRGLSPVSRIISGTVVDSSVTTAYPDPEHWTKGCSGTAGFLKEVLRSVNIPVFMEKVPQDSCKHSQPYFPSEGLYLGHGDDPYVSWYKPINTTVDPPMEDFLIDQDTYNDRFTGDLAEACRNVDRQPLEVMIDYPPELLVEEYCRDLADNYSHAEGRVYQLYQSWYSVQELEARGLWTNLDQQVILLNASCASN
jgi:hypothetical protein